MRNGNAAIHGVAAADLHDVRHSSIGGVVVDMRNDLTGTGAVLFFDTPADFTAWADRLFELAHAVPEIAAAWSTYPVLS